MGIIKTGTIFNIQKFSINDGPGIRTTVFMKGCPLNCIWCHNPESKSSKPEIFYDAKKCLGCRRCEAVCKNGCHTFRDEIHNYNRTDCAACGLCADGCVVNALEGTGYTISVDEVIKEVLKDSVFYETSGGGMTLSGGEPLMQFDFTHELLQEAKKQSLHTCIETCGFTKPENLMKLTRLVDIFLFDYKETDPQKHKEFTGVDNKLILSNLKLLNDSGCNIILRCPIIPTFNDREDHLNGIADTANRFKNITEINLEPYHPLGSSKASLLNRDYPLDKLPIPDSKTVDEWIRFISEKTEVPVKKA